MAKDLDKENKKAPHLNPSQGGVRSGNPQLHPERAKTEPGRAGQKPHRPEIDPDEKKAPKG